MQRLLSILFAGSLILNFHVRLSKDMGGVDIRSVGHGCNLLCVPDRQGGFLP